MKYRLIKTYPGSEGVGYTKEFDGFAPWQITSFPEFWEEVIDNNPLKLEIGKKYILNYKHCERDPFKAAITRITKDGYAWMEKPYGNGIVTDSYELIEEVIEKDYEILSFDSGSAIVKKWENGKFGVYWGEFTEENQLSKIKTDSNRQINSIRRKSDGEIFTVGDQFISESGKLFKIRRFQQIIDNIRLEVVNDAFGSYHRLLNIKPFKKPILTTEDGVEFSKKDMMKFSAFYAGDGKHLKSIEEAFDYFKENLYE